MGAPRDPAGVVNLRANPDVTIEAVVGDDIATIPVHVTELEGEDREAAFRRFVKVVPASRPTRHSTVAGSPSCASRLDDRDTVDRRGDSGGRVEQVGHVDEARQSTDHHAVCH